MSNQYINQMANQLLNSNLTFFIGAGFSRIFGYPGWGQLLGEIIKEHGLKDSLVSTKLFPFIDDTAVSNYDEVNDIILDKLLGVDYLRLAGYVDYLLQTELYISIQEEVVKKIKEYESKRVKTPDVEKIIKFFTDHKDYLEDILTTNYDTNIEFCLDNEVSSIARSLESLNRITNKRKLYKIHGCINDDKRSTKSDIDTSIIITEKDYNNFVNKNKYLFYRVYSIFTERKVCFIGYSINDPNVRSLLNDVIEECGETVNLELYWVTRDKLSPLEKEYYKANYKLNIIEEYEIITFFNELTESVEVNKKLRLLEKADISEVAEKYITNYNNDLYLDMVSKEDKISEVLKSIYTRIMEKGTTIGVSAYLKLLMVASDEEVEKNKLSLQNIVQKNAANMYKVIDDVFKDNEVLDFFRVTNLSNFLADSLIKKAEEHHSFGMYAESIGALLKGYKSLNAEILTIKEAFMQSLVYNINSSTNHSNRILGYDFEGLGVAERYINLLSKDDAVELAHRLSKWNVVGLQRERIVTVITNSSIDLDSQFELLFDLVYRQTISIYLNRLIEVELIKYCDSSKSNEYSNNFYLLNGMYHIVDKSSGVVGKTTYSECIVDDSDNTIFYVDYYLKNNEYVVETTKQLHKFTNFVEFTDIKNRIECDLIDELLNIFAL